MIIGYARVSTYDQKLDLQMDALNAAGCEEIYSDTASGKAKTDRPELSRMTQFARKGDTVVIYKLDRLGRSIKELIELVSALGDRGVDLRVLSPSMDTTTASGRMVFNIFAALAEFERELIVERTQAGLKSAIERGVRLGRRESLTDKEIDKATDFYWNGGGDGEAMKATLVEFGISRATFYRTVKVRLKERQQALRGG